jgi:hypothetical protein
MEEESDKTVIVSVADYAKVVRSSENPPPPEYERDIPVPKLPAPEDPPVDN